MPALKKTYILLSAIILGAILALAIMSIRYNQASRETYLWIGHTIGVLDETQQALSGLHDLEKGLGDGQLYSHLLALQRLTIDNAAQQTRIDSCLSIVGMVRQLGSSQDLHTRSLPVAYSEEIRETLLRLQAEEHRLLAQRQAANADSHRMLSTTIIGLLILIFTLLCGSSILVIFHFNRQLKAEQKLYESERQLSLMVQRERHYAIFILDTEGKIVSWNEGARAIKGYTEEEVVGQPISIFYTREDIDAGMPEHDIKEAIVRGECESVGWRKRKNGSQFWADTIITSLKDAKGALAGFIKITRDISAQRLAEEEIKSSLSHEKALNEMKSRFVSLASHEFKTPLSVILSSVNLIEKYDEPGMSQQRLRHVNRIKSNVNNLRQILNDFLSLEKLESGAIINNPAPTDLVHLATDIITDLESSCKEDQHVLLEVMGTPRLIMADQHLLRNVLNNLLSNAIKYSPAQSLVQFTIRFGSASIAFIVADNGIGIPREEQVHLFERFFRAGNTGSFAGTGLGLSIVKKYLELMDGDIQVVSVPGEGSTFTATIPAIPVHAHVPQ